MKNIICWACLCHLSQESELIETWSLKLSLTHPFNFADWWIKVYTVVNLGSLDLYFTLGSIYSLWRSACSMGCMRFYRSNHPIFPKTLLLDYRFSEMAFFINMNKDDPEQIVMMWDDSDAVSISHGQYVQTYVPSSWYLVYLLCDEQRLWLALFSRIQEGQTSAHPEGGLFQSAYKAQTVWEAIQQLLSSLAFECPSPLNEVKGYILYKTNFHATKRAYCLCIFIII